MTSLVELKRWKIFVQWAQNNKGVVSMYRPKVKGNRYPDYKIRLTIKIEGMGVTFEARTDNMDTAIDEIKHKLLTFKSGELRNNSNE